MPNIIKQENPPSKKQAARKKWLIIVATIIVVAGSVGVWLFLQSQNKATPSVPVVTRNSDEIQQIITDADAKAESGDIAAAKAAYEKAIAETSDGTQKSHLLISDASLYYEEGNYDQALVLAKQAELYKLDENVASMMAEIYKVKGDKQNAKIYYEKSISLTDKTSSIDNNTLYYQNEIEALNEAGN